MEINNIPTIFIGKDFTELTSCHSTNGYLAQLNTDKMAEGAVIATLEQTAGRGQRGTSWEAEPYQNLTFSILLKPHFLAVQEQFLLNMAVALGIYKALQNFLQDKAPLSVKWSNDIYYGEQKIAGILIENAIKSYSLERSIVGIGLNVNQTQFLHAPNATSLSMIEGQTFDLASVLKNVLVEIEKYYILLRNQSFKTIHQQYEATLYRKGQMHWFKREEVTFRGIIKGVEVQTGQLLMEVDQKIEKFSFKEIVFL
ncbi:MAG: biotin--[acetyl-CoA-carboxylase] ligase [Cytophagales bacterium]|nr:MAG: biotin--[acetyl-CoA-carboxylase] ligase [Cytophagales bacterium]